MFQYQHILLLYSYFKRNFNYFSHNFILRQPSQMFQAVFQSNKESFSVKTAMSGKILIIQICLDSLTNHFFLLVHNYSSISGIKNVSTMCDAFNNFPCVGDNQVSIPFGKTRVFNQRKFLFRHFAHVMPNRIYSLFSRCDKTS